MSDKKSKIGSFLKRSKIPVDIEDNKEYGRVTIRINHNGVSLRDTEVGSKIGTKKQFILKDGQFVMSKIDARYGAFGIASAVVDGAIITGNFWAYDVDKKKVNIEWFNQFTNSPDFYDLCERASTGITHRKYLNESYFLNYEIALPSIEDQLSIIEKIKEQKKSFIDLSTELNRQFYLVKKLREQLLEDAVQGKLVSQDENDEPACELLKKIKAEKKAKDKKYKELPAIKHEELPFDIPANWVWCRMGDLAWHSESGKSYKCIEVPINGDEWGVIKLSAISWDTFNENENKLYSVCQPDDIAAQVSVGDFLISRANTSELVGKSVVVKKLTKNLLLSDKTIRFKFSKNTFVDFINKCNNSINSRVYYSKMGSGSSPSMKNITRDHMNCLLIPLPPLAEQYRIVAKLEGLMQTCDELEASIQASRGQSEQLLQKVLREALTNKTN
jgi:type I restriction enzyme, S subunit